MRGPGPVGWRPGLPEDHRVASPNVQARRRRPFVPEEGTAIRARRVEHDDQHVRPFVRDGVGAVRAAQGIEVALELGAQQRLHVDVRSLAELVSGRLVRVAVKPILGKVRIGVHLSIEGQQVVDACEQQRCNLVAEEFAHAAIDVDVEHRELVQIGGHRFAARLYELREAGYDIETERSGKVFVYRLRQ